MGQDDNMESFSTESVAPSQRKAFWNGVVSNTFTQLHSRPRDPDDFSGRLQRVQLGTLSLSQVVSAPARVSHVGCGSSPAESVFLIHLQMHGSSVNTQDGREAVLREGDFTLCDSRRPYTVEFDALNNMLVLRVPEVGLRERLVQPEAFAAQRIAADHGTGGLVSHMLRRLWNLCANGLEPDVAQRLGANLLDLLVIALCAERPALVPASSRVNAQRLRIRQYIEDNLVRPHLEVSTIASAMGITPRYVYRLFEGEEETLGQYIQRRRIEESARRLRDPAQAARSVTRIAFDCAFNEASHFSRCFKKRYGMTPHEFRLRRD